jgi:hypothetical protein
MGKQVTVLNGFVDVMLPTVETVSVASSITGQSAGTVQIVTLAPYSSGAVVTLTDAEYAALSTSTTRALSAPSNVADPSRPSTDTSAAPVTTNATVTGTYTAALGVNVITLTGNVTTFKFPTVPVGSASAVDLVITQDGTGSRLITWTGSGAKFAGGTAPTLSTVAAKVDRLRFVSRGDGATWDLAYSAIALA